ncbi:MAG: DUF3800 domain-containing protein [Pseudomonadota bacterium]
MPGECTIYLDESGDLGFKFDAPYRNGGSSRHITLAAAICDGDSDKYLNRFITDFYSARGINAGTEKKWVDLRPASRVDFATRAAKLRATHRGIRFACISVFKQKVQPHIRKDPNKLYNYMASLMLMPFMKTYDKVLFVPDNRSIRVETGNSLHDYMQTSLWFDHNVNTVLTADPRESTFEKPLHFTDYLCGSFQTHYEDNESDARNALNPCTTCNRLFFP